jgi:methylated-DNA-[protein]-cysteine S-methyltransferase
MENKYTISFLSPLGFLVITGSETVITNIDFSDEQVMQSAKIPPILQACKSQMMEYFSGKRKAFSLPLAPEGTAFQQKVWENLSTIPFGNTTSYAHLASELGDIHSIRAVGNANGKNPIPIIIPCHRVIGADGKLVGYSGGLWRKQWLLEFEERFTKGTLKLFM